MEAWQNAGPLHTYAWCYALLIVSALVPWVNSEVIVLSLSALVPSHTGQVMLVLFAAAGQMTGKSVLFWVGRGVVKLGPGQRALELWRQKIERRQSSGLTVLFLSSTLGIPPLYPMSVLAGSLRVPFDRFVAVGAGGRLLRYAALVFAPRLLVGLLGVVTSYST